jgi:hypothetical protein
MLSSPFNSRQGEEPEQRNWAAVPRAPSPATPQYQVQQQNTRVFRQDGMYFQGREQEASTRPYATPRQPAAIRNSAWAPSADFREEERRAPMPEAAVPAAPRMEPRQVPAASFSAPARSYISGQSSNGRQNH